MREVVLDTSVILKWFGRYDERHAVEARSLRREFETGRLLVFAPFLLQLEIVNVAARRWRWNEAALLGLADAVKELGLAFRDPELERVARWASRGLTAYDAAYLAVAEEEAVSLITDDTLILSIAPGVALPLAG